MSPSGDLYLDYLQTALAGRAAGPSGDDPASTGVRLRAGSRRAGCAAGAAHPRRADGTTGTEHMRSFARVQHAIFPRIAALAETAWSPKAARLRRFPAAPAGDVAAPAGHRYRPRRRRSSRYSMPSRRPDGSARITLRSRSGYPLRYTTDGSASTAASPLYVAPPWTCRCRPPCRPGRVFGGQALAAPLARTFSASSLRLPQRRGTGVRARGQLMLRLEDDGPRGANVAIFNVDIFNPCWTWKQAPLAGIRRSSARWRIPYFFQLAGDEPHRGFKPEDAAWRTRTARRLRWPAAVYGAADAGATCCRRSLSPAQRCNRRRPAPIFACGSPAIRGRRCGCWIG